MESCPGTSNKSKRPTKCEAPLTCDTAVDSDWKSSSKGPMNGKRLKKDDSGINVIPESDSSDESNECAVNSTADEDKLYAGLKETGSELNSPDSGNLETSSLTELEQQDQKEKSNSIEVGETSVKSVRNSHTEKPIEPNSVNKNDNVPFETDGVASVNRKPSACSDTDSDDEDEEDEQYTERAAKRKERIARKYDPTPSTPRPKHNWIAPKSLMSRQYGSSINYSPHLFRYNCYGSLHMVERLELMYKMKKHDGCVNALNFNSKGTKLATGSDDLGVIIWDWTIAEPLIEYSSGHRSNVFQVKFMPLSGDCNMVSCARDGQVRIGELSSEGVCRATRKIAQHKGAAHKLAIQMDSPHTFLSCGEDAVVFGIDLRKEKAEKLAVCKEKEKKIPLYSIFINPTKSYEYIVSGRNQFVKVYDTRFIGQADGFLKQYCPLHLLENEIKANVTSVAYNYNGQEILASYNDEDIYTFDINEVDTSKYLHRYKGCRNCQTVKGVNYFGPKSEFVVSGSDCGYIFFWEKESEHVVKYMYGDEGGVVNCLEPHPNMPVLASSGLDDDIKIWVPSCEDSPDLSGLRDHLIANMKERDEDQHRQCPDEFVDQTIWFLMQHLGRSQARRRPLLWSEIGANPSNSNSNSSDSDDDDSDFSQAIQCNQS